MNTDTNTDTLTIDLTWTFDPRVDEWWAQGAFYYTVDLHGTATVYSVIRATLEEPEDLRQVGKRTLPTVELAKRWCLAGEAIEVGSEMSNDAICGE